jgi:hypothetical protein
MSITRNRELSQFGSFIYIDNTTGNIGIATTATPYIGIGTPNPLSKLHVVGDTSIDGDLTVTNGNIEGRSYTLNGSPLIDASIQHWTFGTGETNIYRLQGNVGIGTSVFTHKLTVLGNVSAGQFISTIASGSGIAPFVVLSDTQVTNLNASFLRGKTPPSGTIVGTSDIQTLTNKTLTSPTINGVTFGSSGIAFTGTTSGNTTLRASAVASGILTLPAATDTLVGRATTESLSNKTISASVNTISGLTNTNLSGTAGITNSNLANSTISGVALGSNLSSLSFGAYISVSGSYNGSTARTVSVAATSINTGNTLVARDISGDFTAGSISVTNITVSQTVQAQNINALGQLSVAGNANITGIITCSDLNSTSDINLKTNIKTVENSIETVNKLRGVSFDWKNTGKSSYGVIAQELEEVLPQLVNAGEVKSVNYNGIIGVLIEAVKELSAEVEELKKKI